MGFRLFLLLTTVVFYILEDEVYSRTVQKGKMYYIQNEKELTWSESFEFCKNMSMRLFTVRNEEEFRFLKMAVKRDNDYVRRFWMGAYRYDGIFRWLPDGEQITRFFWHELEPNDKSGNENCIQTWGEDFDWNDNDCDSRHCCICEREL